MPAISTPPPRASPTPFAVASRSTAANGSPRRRPHSARSSGHRSRRRARYNLGNARFKQGDLVGAIDAYEQVLNAVPDHDDAHHNLALARGLLAKQEQQAFEQDKEEPKPTPELGIRAGIRT